mgnify:CR=1 FL=1
MSSIKDKDESLISANINERSDITFRPAKLQDFIGQKSICSNIGIFVNATKKRKEPLDLVLLFGPPGTGKTMLAKAAASQSESNFIAIRGPEILSKWVGDSQKAVRKTFKKARESAPCIVFFDELDAIAPKRGIETAGVSDKIVNQLLSEMDGIDTLKNVVVIGATNRPDMLDLSLIHI